MPSQFDHYTVSATDWRKTLAQNNRRTYFVIFLFFLIYTSVGLLMDMYVCLNHYPHVDLERIFTALITFKIFPLATTAMLCIAAISLMIAYRLYDKLMLLGTEYHEVTPTDAKNTHEQQLYNVIEEMKIAAGLRYMPRVFIIEADYMNAFASGYSEKSAMVAITRGLMEKLNRDELQAVMAHELSHIRHLDIKLTLTASLLANLTLMAIDFFFYNILFSGNRRDSNDRSRNVLFTAIIILRYLLPIINILLLLYLSRRREIMADAGSVELMRSNQPLASALLKISDDHSQNRDAYNQAYAQTPHENVRREAYIFDPIQAGFESTTSIGDLFSTHPSIETRLALLGFKKQK